MFAGAPFAAFNWAGHIFEQATLASVGGTPIPRRRRWWRPRIQEDEEALMRMIAP
jgi:hypothetical protein